MGVGLEIALTHVQPVAGILFAADPSVRSVGVGRNGDGFGLVAVRNVHAPIPYAGRLGALPESHAGIPIRYLNSAADPAALSQVPHTGPGSPGTYLVPEQLTSRPLAVGLQIQNFDDDSSTGTLAAGYLTVGTIGCFVKLSDGSIGLLSNNHVVGAQNHGNKLMDRILQRGGATFVTAEHVATLHDFVNLVASPSGATVGSGVVLNEVDAGVARLDPTVSYSQSYLPSRSALPPKGTALAAIGDKVHKVGRTTGLQFGEVTQVGTVVGPIPYGRIGGCWFDQSIVIEGVNGANFSDRGDSGSAIVRDSDGMVIGLLYAGNGTQTYACPIAPVLSLLGCQLI